MSTQANDTQDDGETITAIVKPKNTLPANYEEQLAAEALAMAKRIGAPSGDLIRINKDKTFSLPDGATSPTLGVIVAGFVAVNQYYPGKFDPKEIKPPVCMATGTEIIDMRPWPESPELQGKDGCHTCWANQWGTDGKGKACKNQRMLAVLGPKGQMDGPMMTLKVSPTGTRYWDNYVTQVMQLTGALIKVITEISFDANADYPSLRFKVLGPNDTWQDAFGRRGPAMERLMTKPDFTPAVVAPKPDEKGKAKPK